MQVDAFEPNDAECARLAATSHPNIRWHATALAGTAGARDLYVLATPTGSSFFPPDPDFVEQFGFPEYHAVAKVTQLECTTLASHLDAVGSGGPDLIKLDTQGSELEILQGMRPEQLEDVLLVELETEIHPAYNGQPVFTDVHAVLEGSGFRLLDVRVQRVYLTGGVAERHYLRRHLSTAAGSRTLTAQVHALDAVYIRPMRTVLSRADPAAFARFATILQMYRYYDGIFWLLDRTEAAAMFDESTRATITRSYERAAPKPTFMQRTGTLPQAFRRARRATSYLMEHAMGADGFDPPRTAWTHTYWPDS
jgi:FkbM family methyltransferase